MKILQEETSSRYFLFTASRYRTSENPLFFALANAFRMIAAKTSVSCKDRISMENDEIQQVWCVERKNRERRIENKGG